MIFQGKHDPSGQISGPWTFRLLLNAGDSITNATVTVVDGADNPVVSPDLDVFDVSFGSILEPELGEWGVSFYLQNGSPQFYNLRLRYTTNHSPAVGGDITMRLRCAQT